MTGIPGFAEIRFKGTRKDYFTYEAMDLAPGAHVIVEADRGEDLGEVAALGAIAQRKCSSSGGCSVVSKTMPSSKPPSRYFFPVSSRSWLLP